MSTPNRSCSIWCVTYRRVGLNPLLLLVLSGASHRPATLVVRLFLRYNVRTPRYPLHKAWAHLGASSTWKSYEHSQ